jgi:hypothetical protein
LATSIIINSSLAAYMTLCPAKSQEVFLPR